jgi:hypothetical protein
VEDAANAIALDPKCVVELHPKTHAGLPHELLDLCCTGQAKLLMKVVIAVPFLARGLGYG